MSQPTPGPWTVNEMYAPEHGCRRPTPYILDSRGRHIAAALNGDPSITDDEHAANARLIAQAPAMREALADLLAWGVELDDDRIGYIIVQVNRGSALAARALLKEIEP